MNWELFYMVCFVVGFAFSVISFLGGALNSHVHLPKHFHLGHGAAHAQGARGGVRSGAHFSLINPLTLAAFLTWFGGAGYLLVHLRHIWVFAGLALASAAGLVAAGIVFLFVAKVLMANEKELDPLDYDMIGVLGHVSSTIRSGGTGEIVFAQEGVRKPCAARGETGEQLAKGEEVVVTRYERGVAYVRRWDELADSAGVSLKQESRNQ